jgi:acetyl esterase/lipase
MHDDAYMLRHQLRTAGVPHTLKQYDGYPHFFHILPQLEGSKKFMRDLEEAIREQCS